MDKVPEALGQPLFYKFKSDLAKSLMSLGASTALEFGLGKDSASSLGLNFHKEKKHYGG